MSVPESDSDTAIEFSIFGHVDEHFRYSKHIKATMTIRVLASFYDADVKMYSLNCFLIRVCSPFTLDTTKLLFVGSTFPRNHFWACPACQI